MLLNPYGWVWHPCECICQSGAYCHGIGWLVLGDEWKVNWGEGLEGAWTVAIMLCIYLDFSSAGLPMEEQLRRLQEERTCKVCMDREVSIVFIPCGHLVVCKECAPSLRKCPICRGTIKGTVRTFLSWGHNVPFRFVFVLFLVWIRASQWPIVTAVG